MVNGSGSWGRRPGTHFQSGDSAFHRWTCASTIMRRSAWADASRAPCAARTAPAPRLLVTKLRRVGMDRSSLKLAVAAFVQRHRLAGPLCDFPTPGHNGLGRKGRPWSTSAAARGNKTWSWFAARWTLHDANVQRVRRRVLHGASDRRMPVGPSDQAGKLLGVGVVRADPDGGAKRRHPRRDPLVESEDPAVIAVAFDGDLERREIHAQACARMAITVAQHDASEARKN